LTIDDELLLLRHRHAYCYNNADHQQYYLSMFTELLTYAVLLVIATGCFVTVAGRGTRTRTVFTMIAVADEPLHVQQQGGEMNTPLMVVIKQEQLDHQQPQQHLGGSSEGSNTPGDQQVTANELSSAVGGSAVGDVKTERCPQQANAMPSSMAPCFAVSNLPAADVSGVGMDTSAQSMLTEELQQQGQPPSELSHVSGQQHLANSSGFQGPAPVSLTPERQDNSASADALLVHHPSAAPPRLQPPASAAAEVTITPIQSMQQSGKMTLQANNEYSSMVDELLQSIVEDPEGGWGPNSPQFLNNASNNPNSSHNPAEFGLQHESSKFSHHAGVESEPSCAPSMYLVRSLSSQRAL
jgi:hypothetical protein